MSLHHPLPVPLITEEQIATALDRARDRRRAWYLRHPRAPQTPGWCDTMIRVGRYAEPDRRDPDGWLCVGEVWDLALLLTGYVLVHPATGRVKKHRTTVTDAGSIPPTLRSSLCAVTATNSQPSPPRWSSAAWGRVSSPVGTWCSHFIAMPSLAARGAQHPCRCRGRCCLPVWGILGARVGRVEPIWNLRLLGWVPAPARGRRRASARVIAAVAASDD